MTVANDPGKPTADGSDHPAPETVPAPEHPDLPPGAHPENIVLNLVVDNAPPDAGLAGGGRDEDGEDLPLGAPPLDEVYGRPGDFGGPADSSHFEPLGGGWQSSSFGEPPAPARRPETSAGPRLVSSSSAYETLFGPRSEPQDEPPVREGPRLVSDNTGGGYETVFGVRSMPTPPAQDTFGFASAGSGADEEESSPFESFGTAHASELPMVFRAPPEAVPHTEASGLLADAVQSALRNIYGGEETAASASASASTSRGGDHDNPIIANAAAVWEGLNRTYSGDPRRPGSPELDDDTTEAVLSYLYDQQGDSRPPARQVSLSTLGDADAGFAGAEDTAASYWRKFEEPRYEEPRYEEQRYEEPRYEDQRHDAIPDGIRPGRDMGGFGVETPPSYAPQRSESGGFQPVQEQQFSPASIGSSFEQRFGAMMPDHVRVEAPSRPMPPVAGRSPERESGRLLGAAGLGLIGGIALAGVLAVYVSNTFTGERNAERVFAPEVPRIEAAAPSGQLSAIPGGVSTGAPVIKAPPVAARPTSNDPLTVADVSGGAETPIPLSINVFNTYQSGDAMVSLKGLPKDASLSQGIDVGGGAWLMPADQLSDLRLTLPKSAPARNELQAQLLQSDGRTPLSAPRGFTVSLRDGAQDFNPWAATAQDNTPRTGRPGMRQSSDPIKTVQLIREGNKLMRDGDIAGARKLYDQAVALGDPEGSLAMGRSYDPLYFEQLQVKTGKPDPALAFEWYKKAMDGGIDSAKVKIDTLKQWLLR